MEVLFMDRKYNMTKEDNIFFAKRKLIDNLYKSANLEGIAVTFADTYSFMNNVNTGKISIDDMLKLKGLKDAWEYVLNTIDEELTIDYIKKVHFEICKGQNITPLGNFRDRGVGITGTSWRPKLPEECNYTKDLQEILNSPHKLEKCINLFCYLQRSQMFIDGNKRIGATLFIYFLNYYDILFKNGNRIIDNNTLTALTLLVAQSNPKEKDILIDLIMNFLKEN